MKRIQNKYYCIEYSYLNNDFTVNEYFDTADSTSDVLFSRGNYFETSEEAFDYRDKVIKLFQDRTPTNKQ